jgi:hypothetical protein
LNDIGAEEDNELVIDEGDVQDVEDGEDGESLYGSEMEE